MTPRELVAIVMLSLGPRPRLEARDALGRFVRGECKSIELQYEYIHDWSHINSLLRENEDVDMLDGQSTITLRLS